MTDFTDHCHVCELPQYLYLVNLCLILTLLTNVCCAPCLFLAIRRHVDHTDMSNYERAILARQLARLRMQDFRAFVVHFGKDMQAMSRGPMT